MNQPQLTPEDVGRMAKLERLPGEAPFEYLVRCMWAVADRVRQLETERDAQEATFVDERAHWRRHMILLAVGEAGFAAAAYVLLAYCGLPASLNAPLVAGLIGSCALAGAFASIRILSMREILTSWARVWDNRARRLIFWIMPAVTEAERMPEPAIIAHDRAGQLPVEPEIEDRIAEYLKMETFMWRLRLLFVETMIIAILVFAAQLLLGLPFLAVIDSVMLIATVCLCGGFLLLFLSDFMNSRLARLNRRWRGR